MRGQTRWDARPFLTPYDDAGKVYITRLAPGETGAALSWTSVPGCTEYTVSVSPRETDARREIRVRGTGTFVPGLAPDTEYRVSVRPAGERGSAGPERLFRTGKVPGTVIQYLHPDDRRYAFSGHALCSPCLVKLPSGALLASMDVYGGRAPQCLTMLFRSDDRGESWQYVCDLYPCFWGKLFVHRGRLYMLALSTEFGDVLIGASDDEGRSWCAPVRLFPGSSTVGRGWQQSPMPELVFGGRILFSMEYAGRGVPYGACILSAPEDADLLDPAVWRMTQPFVPLQDIAGLPGAETECFIEGNLYVSPEGRAECLLRHDGKGFDPMCAKAARLLVDPNDPEAAERFGGFADLPCGAENKFMLRQDPQTGLYIVIGNRPVSPRPGKQRTVLAMYASRDARSWRFAADILGDPDADPERTGFQYPSFLIDGEDILLQVRTAVNGARNFHDANYSTFHILRDFRRTIAKETGLL